MVRYHVQAEKTRTECDARPGKLRLKIIHVVDELLPFGLIGKELIYCRLTWVEGHSLRPMSTGPELTFDGGLIEQSIHGIIAGLDLISH